MIDKEILYKIAQSSKLKINVDEEEMYIEDLNKIIFFIHKLNEVDFEDDSDFHFVNQFNLNLRDDIRGKFQSIDLIKNNAPDFRNNYFVLPNHLKKERK
ncbi:MAG: Glu-tRNAGln amidotransferase subunit [Bacteroidales bacterium]|jgi:aspartyl-tRNA(Asn)/glutamyl-tRNA(Gln) amidotransferase subunit C|nr:Glu-tRNAGln amidotransferase subunit [Bacteroidales bacterium]